MTTTNRFANLTFERFRELAKDDSLSRHEKVGFPDAYREGKEAAVFRDVLAKMGSLQVPDSVVLEIGPGCSQLPLMLAEHCEARGQKVLFVDSEEMLRHLPDEPHLEKLPGCFPQVDGLFERYAGQVRSIVTYSVIQYAFADGNVWDFFDKAMLLLCDGGEMLIGDIPNMTMRKRFFSGNEGIACHQAYTGTTELPAVAFNQLEPGQMDDSVVLALVARARAQGFHAWIVPQSADLPMANRREDILIRKP